MKLSEFSVKHPAVISMLLIVLIAFGIFSVSTTNVEFMSDISMPSVIVVSVYPGANAEDVEQDIASVMESDFVTLPNFKSISSVSKNSVCMVTITFQDGADPYDQLPEVRNRISQLMPDLPEGLAGTPSALVGGATMLPIFTFSVLGGKDTGRITEYINKTLTPRITSISGVSSVSLSGGKELRADVKLHLQDLNAKGISVTQVYQILNYGNVSLPSGSATFEQSNIDIRYSGSFNSLEDMKALPVGAGKDNVVVHLGDIADVTLSYPKEESYMTDGENPLILVSVSKRLDGNTLSVCNKIKKVLAQAEKETDGALRFDIISDDSRTVGASLRTVVSSGISGVIIAILVIFLFLNNWRTTLIIGISIPLSILFTFIGMKIAGITVNLMSLSGLVVALGMIVDGSIVILEQVYRHYTERSPDGKLLYSRNQAIFLGSGEVGGAIFASTATTVVVFLPISMVSGIVGMILKDVSLTLIFSLCASFLVSVTVVPFLMSFILKPEFSEKKQKTTKFNRLIEKIEIYYRKALVWSLKSWKFVLLVAILILLFSLFITGGLGMAFIPSTDNSDFFIALDMPVGQTLDETDAKTRQAYRILMENVPEVQSTAVYTGVQYGSLMSSSTPNASYMHVVLVPVAQRKRDIHDIILLMQTKLSEGLIDCDVTVSNGGFDKLVGYVSGGGGYGLTLVSEDMDLLYETAVRIQERLKEDPDVVVTALDTNFDSATMIIDMSQDYMSSLGITSYEAGVISNILFNGIDCGRFRNEADDTRYAIRLYSDITEKPVTKDTIADISVLSMAGTKVSFASLSDINVKKSISQINHTDRRKTITVSATLVSEDASSVNSRMNSYLAQNPLPQGVESKTGGMMELLGDSLPPMIQALAIAVFLVYTVMVLQFEKFRQPLLVMAAIPFCLIGVIASLLVFGSTISMLSLLGVIALAGVVVNNGIILIDYINLLRKQRKERQTPENQENWRTLAADIATGSSSRIRPIFMTTLTTMLGVVPMAIASGEGAEIYAPLGQAIAGGLITSTIITLFIIPILYYVTERKGLSPAPAKTVGNDSSKKKTEARKSSSKRRDSTTSAYSRPKVNRF
ncbi:MAG: efflux RND transporter permease subunit [Treponemataceae bacterium]|nr:efflux RND transporter permease subunit [Treponemataceae bacterium]